MAGTLSALLMIVGICLTGLGVGEVSGELPECVSVKRCQEDFQQQASKLGHVQSEFCRLVTEEVQCIERFLSSCPSETRNFAKSRLEAAQRNRQSACGATWIEVSHWLLTVSAILAVVFHRFF